jgi:uncharacterized delta-60 repeat protein
MHFCTTFQRAWLLIFSTLLIAPTHAAAQAGQLDPSFGQGGIVTTDFGSQINSDIATANAITIQPDGRIVVCGGAPGSNGFPNATVTRYNPDGTLDKGFGNAGFNTLLEQFEILTAIALQTDGKIVATGAAGEDIDVIRFNSDGQLDSTFGTNGIASFFALGVLNSGIVVQPDGDILVGNGNLLIRFLPSGQLDLTFGSGGSAKVAGFNPTALALLSNGKILVASALISGGFENPGFVTRYNSDGGLDPSFGINGQLSVPGPASAMVLLNARRFAGEFVVAGNLTSSVNGPVSGFAVSGYKGVGTVDARFGTNGGAVTPVPNFPTITTSGLGLQSSGDIVTSGTGSTSSVSTVFALARYTPAGTLDPTFGTAGIVTTSLPNTSEVFTNGLAIQPDDKIVLVGNYTTSELHGQFDTGFKLARYLGH